MEKDKRKYCECDSDHKGPATEQECGHFICAACMANGYCPICEDDDYYEDRAKGGDRE